MVDDGQWTLTSTRGLAVTCVVHIWDRLAHVHCCLTPDTRFNLKCWMMFCRIHWRYLCISHWQTPKHQRLGRHWGLCSKQHKELFGCTHQSWGFHCQFTIFMQSCGTSCFHKVTSFCSASSKKCHAEFMCCLCSKNKQCSAAQILC